MRTRVSRWTLGAALSIAVTVGGAVVGTMPAHGQSITGLGQADQQFNRCHFPTLDDGICGGNSYDGGGKGWQFRIPSVEPAVGLVPSPCRRGVENE
jgi:hypothetical protein